MWFWAAASKPNCRRVKAGLITERQNPTIPMFAMAPSMQSRSRKDGMLERIIGKSETMVNSIHRQGVKKLAPGLNAEATYPRWHHRSRLGQGRQGLCLRHPMARGIQGRQRSGFRKTLHRLRRCGPRPQQGPRQHNVQQATLRLIFCSIFTFQ